MLEKPPIADETIRAALQESHGLNDITLEFLPLGADANTAVYRVRAGEDGVYFLKLRRGDFSPAAVTLPAYLAAQGIPQIIAPIPTRSGRLWAKLPDFFLILFPFVAGQDGYAVELTAAHWRTLGAALKRLHTSALPPELRAQIPRETYNPAWRVGLNAWLGRLAAAYPDPHAAQTAALLRAQRTAVQTLLERAARLAAELQADPPEFVLCHTDLHAGNVHLDARGALYIVDWDNPLLAPKERDLMYPGGGQGFKGHSPAEEEALFFQGYGPAEVNRAALAYYRCERIVQDLAIFCDDLIGGQARGADRPQALRYLQSNFVPGGVLEIALRTV